MSAAPVTATRKVERSCSSRSGMVEDGLVERWWSGQDGDPLGSDPGEHTVHVEHRLGEHRRPRRHTGQNPRLEPEHVEVGIHLQIDVAGRESGHGHPVRGDGERAPVRHHDALWHAGGARGEEDVRRVVGSERGAPASDFHQALGSGSAHEVRPGQRAVGDRAPHHHAGGQVGQRRSGGFQEGDVVGVQEVRDGHQGLGLAPCEQVGGLGSLEPGVDRDEDATGGEDTEDGHHPVGAVEAPDAHPVTGLDARLDQRSPESVSRRRELRVRHESLVVAYGQQVTELVGGTRHHGRDARPRGHAHAFCEGKVVPSPAENDALAIQ